MALFLINPHYIARELFMDSKELQQAITLWSEGQPIPLNLWLELSNQGLDVQALEDKYLNNWETNKFMSLIKTPVGVAQYPHLNTPDTKFNPVGEYKVNIVVPVDEAQDFIESVEAVYEEAYDLECKQKKKKKIKRADFPWELNEEETHVIIKTKMKAKVETKSGDSWTQRPALFDAAGKPMSPKIRIGGGSELLASIEAYPWFAPSLGFGISLRPKAVQVIKLIQGDGKSAEDFGFGAVERGYVAEGMDESEFEDEDYEDNDVDQEDDEEEEF